MRSEKSALKMRQTNQGKVLKNTSFLSHFSHSLTQKKRQVIGIFDFFDSVKPISPKVYAIFLEKTHSESDFSIFPPPSNPFSGRYTPLFWSFFSHFSHIFTRNNVDIRVILDSWRLSPNAHRMRICRLLVRFCLL